MAKKQVSNKEAELEKIIKDQADALNKKINE